MAAEDATLALHTLHMLVQMMAALRNLATNVAHRTAFVTSGIIEHLCLLLTPFGKEVCQLQKGCRKDVKWMCNGCETDVCKG